MTTVVGLAVGVVKLVSEITKTLESLNKVFNNLDDLNLQLAANQAKILSWQSLWTFEETKTDDFFLALWGQSGREDIEKLLRSIYTDCDSLKSTIANLVGAGGQRGSILNVNHSSNKHPLLRFLRMNKRPQAEKRKDEIRSKVKSLSCRVDELYNNSTSHFKSLHATAPERLLDTVSESRHLSRDIYSQCQKAGLDLYLDIDLLNNEEGVDKVSDLYSWGDLTPIFHIFIDSKASSPDVREVFLEPYALSDTAELTQTHTEPQELPFHLAVRASHMKGLIRRSSSYAAAEKLLLATSKSITTLPADRSRALSSLFENESGVSRTDTSQRIELAERIFLAYRIVECGLFLLGTPWLSSISSRSIYRSTAKISGNQYLLHVPQSAELEYQFPKPINLEKAQIFKLGLLLLEIALEHAFESTESPDLQELLSSLSEVEDRMGTTYRKACEYCLHEIDEDGESILLRSSTSLDGQQGSLVERYYREVFLR